MRMFLKEERYVVKSVLEGIRRKRVRVGIIVLKENER